MARLYATEARGLLGYVLCERDGVATPGRNGAVDRRPEASHPPTHPPTLDAGTTLRPSDALNVAAIVLSHDKHDDGAALAKAIEAVDADPRSRPAVSTLVWLLLRLKRTDDAEDVLARCPAEDLSYRRR